MRPGAIFDHRRHSRAAFGYNPVPEVFRWVMTCFSSYSKFGSIQFLYHIDTKGNFMLQLGKFEVLENTVHADRDAVWASHVRG